MSKTSRQLLKLNSGVADQTQIVKDINQALKTVKGRNHGQFMVNVVEVKGKKIGESYVWFEKAETADLFLTKIIKVPDSNWIRPATPPPVQAPTEPLTFEEIVARSKSKSSDWCDLVEEEEEEKNRFVQPMIEQTVGPIAIMPAYPLTEEMKKEFHEQAKGAAIWNKTWVEGMEIKVPSVGTYSFEPVTVGQVKGPGRPDPNVLVARDVPEWVTEADMKMFFNLFVTDGKTKIKRKVDGRMIQDTYPFININRTLQKAFITFDPETYDAQFARIMSRKVEFSKGDSQAKTCVLFFDHPRSTK
jgi:hypothetical protein